MSEKTDIKSMDLEELKTFFSDMGEKAFRSSHSEKNRYRFQNWMEPANICFYWKTEMSLRVC